MDEKKLLNCVRDLVSIPSYQDTGEIREYICSYIKNLGFLPVVDKIGNIKVEIGSERAFLLNAHVDTVPPKGWEDAFQPIINHKKLYGLGASDDKAGVACLLELLRSIREEKIKGSFVFLFSVNEEAHPLEKNGAFYSLPHLNVHHALVLEPRTRENGEILLGVGCRGIYRSHIIIKGKRHHSGTPSPKDNALYLALDFVNKLREQELPSVTLSLNGKIFSLHADATITQIKAEEGMNVAPGLCHLDLDYRCIPKESKNSIEKWLHSLLKEAKLKDKVFFSNSWFYPAYFCSDKKFIEACLHIAKEENIILLPSFSSGRNDSTVFGNYGNIPSLVLGPGTMGQAHKRGEYLYLPGFFRSCNFIEVLIRELPRFFN